MGGALPGLVTFNPELALAGAVLGGLGGAVGGGIGGYLGGGFGGMTVPGRGALTTGIYGGAVAYGISSTMQGNGYPAAISNFTGGTLGGALGGAGAAYLAGSAVGSGIGLGAWSGALGAATANAVSGWLHIINADFGDCHCGK